MAPPLRHRGDPIQYVACVKPLPNGRWEIELAAQVKASEPWTMSCGSINSLLGVAVRATAPCRNLAHRRAARMVRAAARAHRAKYDRHAFDVTA